MRQGNLRAGIDRLNETLDPRNSGVDTYLICTFPVVYARIAWRHGFEVRVDSQWVPKAWLPVAPLRKYEDAFAFMAQSDDATQGRTQLIG